MVSCLLLQRVLRGIKRHKAQSVNMNPSQLSWCTLFSSPWIFTTIQCFRLPAVLGFLDSHTLLSSPSTPTLIPTSTLLLAMSKQSPQSIVQAASGSTLSGLRWTPFAKVAINYLHWCWKMWSLPHARPYPVSTCPWLNSWPTFPSFWWHPFKSPKADI